MCLCAEVYACVCAGRTCVRECARVRVHCMCDCERLHVRALVGACAELLRVRAFVQARVLACACVRVCMCACSCVCA